MRFAVEKYPGEPARFYTNIPRKAETRVHQILTLARHQFFDHFCKIEGHDFDHPFIFGENGHEEILKEIGVDTSALEGIIDVNDHARGLQVNLHLDEQLSSRGKQRVLVRYGRRIQHLIDYALRDYARQTIEIYH